MSARTSNYSDFLARVCALLGLDQTTLQASELANINALFIKNLRKIWRFTPWLDTMVLETRTPDVNFVIDYNQAAQTAIGEVLGVWDNNPLGTVSANSIGYVPTSTGLQLIGMTVAAPVWVRYTIRIPAFTGSTYSASSTYASGVTTYFTSSTGYGNYYTSTGAVLANQTPDTNPSLWSVNVLPYTFLEYVAFATYADYLRSDGQQDKAYQADSQAEMILIDEYDIMQRQQRYIPTTYYNTHLTSRPLN